MMLNNNYIVITDKLLYFHVSSSLCVHSTHLYVYALGDEQNDTNEISVVCVRIQCSMRKVFGDGDSQRKMTKPITNVPDQQKMVQHFF